MVGWWSRWRLQSGVESAISFVQLPNRLNLSLLFHSSVLKPNLDLSLGQLQLVGQLNATAAWQVAVELEVLLEFQGLQTRVRLSTTTALRWVGTYRRRRHTSSLTTLSRYFVVRLHRMHEMQTIVTNDRGLSVRQRLCLSVTRHNSASLCKNR